MRGITRTMCMVAAATLAGCSNDDGTATGDATSTTEGSTGITDGPSSADSTVATSSTGSGTEDPPADSGSSDDTGPQFPNYDGDPLDITRDGAWEWFDIEGVACADGRHSGVGVRAVENPEGLVVYFKGGGACFNAQSCGVSAPLMLTGFEAIDANPDGVLNFEDPQNPLLNYDVVYVPYCTGDIHGGSAPATSVEGLAEPWDFIGHDNVLLSLDRVAPTFPDPERVVVLGSSAGGIGALVNFPAIHHGWPEHETFLLDDSGMIFRDPYLAPCLQQTMRQTWALENVLPSDCPECETPDGGGMAQYFVYLADHYPQTHFGLVASNRDRVVRIFFGYGNDDCAPAAGLPDLGEQTLMDALDDLRQEVLADRFASYVVDSDEHVWTTTPEFYTVQTGDTPLYDWFDAFLAGEATDVAP